MKKIPAYTFFLFFFFSFLVPAQGSQKLVYYSHSANPPESKRLPPFEGTRKQTERGFYYMNVRYPYEKATPGRNSDFPKGVTFTFSFGNELQETLFVSVDRLVLTSAGKFLNIKPSFYNGDAKEKQMGVDALKRYTFNLPLNLHERVEVLCEDCDGSQPELRLEVDISVHNKDKSKKGSISEVIKLYRGYYTP